MNNNNSFFPRPTMDDFLGNPDSGVLNLADKSDIFWCLSQEGITSLAIDHSGMVFSPIENFIAGYIVNKLVDLAKKKECEECIDCIIKKHSGLKDIEIDLFDLLMREYVWQMGKVCYKLRSNPMPALRGVFAGLFTSRSGMQEFENQYNKNFVNVYKELNTFSYIILTNLFKPYALLSEEQYKHLTCKYITDSHVKFENLEAPDGHVFEGLSFLDIIFKNRDTTSDYYKDRYKDYTSLSKGFTSDYAKNFYARSSPIGDEKIYELK